MADRAAEPIDGAGDGQPHLETAFRQGHRENGGEFRKGRSATDASGTAGLAGNRVCEQGVEYQGDASADDDVEHLPAEFSSHVRRGENRSGEQAAVPHAVETD